MFGSIAMEFVSFTFISSMAPKLHLKKPGKYLYYCYRWLLWTTLITMYPSQFSCSKQHDSDFKLATCVTYVRTYVVDWMLFASSFCLISYRNGM